MLKPKPYIVVPKHLATTEAIVNMIVKQQQDELDINLTLLGAVRLSSAELSAAIKDKTFDVGSHILAPFKTTLMPFMILDYCSDGTAFCQTMMTVDKIKFDEINFIDYRKSKSIYILRNIRGFKSDLLKNHVVQHDYDIETDDPDTNAFINEQFALMNIREMFTYCRTVNSRRRYDYDGNEIIWDLREINNAFRYTSNFINMTDRELHVQLFNALVKSNASAYTGIVPVCYMK